MKNYDLCVIGAGPGGTAAAIEASSLGAKTAIIERDEIGGVCLNRGCIPTKAHLKSALLYDECRRSGEFGISSKGFDFSLPLIRQRSADIVNRLKGQLDGSLRALKIEVIKGEASFLDRKTIAVGDEKIDARAFIIATGSSPRIIGSVRSEKKRIFYSEEILGIERMPADITIIGGGPIGCEFASFFAALGSRVNLIEMLERILPKEDRDLSNRLEGIFRKKGIEVSTGVCSPDIGKIKSEIVLISVGRSPNTGGIGLEKAGVSVDDGRIIVDEYLKTSAENISAVGDCIGRYNLAHAASAEGKTAARNALGENTAMDYSIMPMCVYSFPEAASVGLNAEEAEKKGYGAIVGRAFFAGSGRALAQGETEGFLKLVAEKKTGKVLGAQILGYNASELIGIISVAIKGKLTVNDLADVTQPHPSFSEAVQEAASNMIKQAK
ncbi:MAG: dihydrolipoyl dehydrogenase [Omnitrophica WOR_2 bacterium RIFCSPLOWO2_02_FULL_50_19]|nr:MAG: dihydrolipoyl dehydrogenase [Omnitrophica WOR_2 bacterium RIFCSPLOWO2_02_FULL_50_19]